MLKFFAVVVTNGGGGQGSTYSNANAQNPYWKTFNPYVEPLLERPMDLRRFNELEEER